MAELELSTSAPVKEGKRIETLDVIRGFAMLGILVPNIVAFSWPQMAMSETKVYGMTLDLLGTGPANDSANALGHFVTQCFFHGKMMFLFALLFGAGVVMYSRKFDDPDRPVPLRVGAGLWYRRMAWLFAIGLTHAVFLWFGDILVWYALSGLALVWWLRRLKPAIQILIAVPSYLFGVALLVLFTAVGSHFHNSGDFDLFSTIPTEVQAYRGSYLDALVARLWTLIQMYVFMAPLFWVSIMGIMLAGIALTRLGILTGERSNRFYAALAFGGLALGFGLTGLTIWWLDAANVELAGMYFSVLGQLVGIPTSLGYAAVLILLVRNKLLGFVTNALAAVGRMALSNYLMQTLICTTIFYGYGFGQFARIQYPHLWLVVGGVWAANITFSVLWLRVFQFGPLEWVWRSLTYWKVMPLRRTRSGLHAG